MCHMCVRTCVEVSRVWWRKEVVERKEEQRYNLTPVRFMALEKITGEGDGEKFELFLWILQPISLKEQAISSASSFWLKQVCWYPEVPARFICLLFSFLLISLCVFMTSVLLSFGVMSCLAVFIMLTFPACHQPMLSIVINFLDSGACICHNKGCLLPACYQWMLARALQVTWGKNVKFH